MTKLHGPLLSAILISSAFAPAAAQLSAPSITSALPNVSSISPANAAGVLQYCAQHELVSSAAIDPVLGSLTAKKGLTSSPLYSAGQQGKIVTGQKSFSLGLANGFLKSQACDMVFRQAAHFK